MVHNNFNKRAQKFWDWPLEMVPKMASYDNKNALVSLGQFNRDQGNIHSALLLEHICLYCCDVDRYLESSKVWYAWDSKTWSPAVVVKRESGHLVIAGRRRSRSSKAKGPHMGSFRDDREELICQWFELLPRENDKKPEAIRERIGFPALENAMRQLDMNWSIDESKLYYDHLGQLLSQRL